jgi:hypothetical protein
MRQLLLIIFAAFLAGQASGQVAEEDLFKVDPAVQEHNQLTLAAEAGQEAFEAHAALLAAKMVEESAQSAYDAAVVAAVKKAASSTVNQDENLEMLAADLANRKLIEAKARVAVAHAVFETKQDTYTSAIGTAGIEALAPAKQVAVDELTKKLEALTTMVEDQGKKVTMLEEKVTKLEARDGRTTTWCSVPGNSGTKLCRERANLQTQ